MLVFVWRYKYPLSAKTLEPLACFVTKLPTDSDFANEGFPGIKHAVVGQMPVWSGDEEAITILI